MTLQMILIIILAIDITVFSHCVAKYFANKHSKLLVEEIERIGKIDIPIGEKIDLMNKVRQ